MKLLLLALLAADPRTVAAFQDKGDYFIRAGTNAGLKVGSEVLVLGDQIGDTGEYRTAGKAHVLEVWETLARISPDEDALNAGVKLVRVGGQAASKGKSAPAAVAAEPPQEKVNPTSAPG